MDAKNLDCEDHVLWPESIESYFIGLLHDETKKGLQTTTLDKKRWQKIKNDIYIIFNLELNLPDIELRACAYGKGH